MAGRKMYQADEDKDKNRGKRRKHQIIPPFLEVTNKNRKETESKAGDGTAGDRKRRKRWKRRRPGGGDIGGFAKKDQ